MLLPAMFDNPLGVTREMDRLFDAMPSSRPIASAPILRSSGVYPAVNVWEHEDHLAAEAELPGLSIDDVRVQVLGDRLIIEGERRIEAPDGAKSLRRERGIGQFRREITLPDPIDADRVEATLVAGVLTVTLPKRAEAMPRRIEVKALPRD